MILFTYPSLIIIFFMAIAPLAFVLLYSYKDHCSLIEYMIKCYCIHNSWVNNIFIVNAKFVKETLYRKS